MAEICYVHLADVLAPSKVWTSSRWFSRGWTLQELIAPRIVEFYDLCWEPLGSRISARDEISSVTGIPGRVLEGYPLAKICAAQKMYWASSRQTTRVEDAAYSLLGLFDINMPLLYGEGKKAFRRLQEEILRRTQDHTLLAWEMPNDDVWSILASSPRFFQSSGDIAPLPGSKAPRIELTVDEMCLRLPVYVSTPFVFIALNCQRVPDESETATPRLQCWLDIVGHYDINGSSMLRWGRLHCVPLSRARIARPRAFYVAAYREDDGHGLERVLGAPAVVVRNCISTDRIISSLPLRRWHVCDTERRELWMSVGARRGKDYQSQNDDNEPRGILVFQDRMNPCDSFALLVRAEQRSLTGFEWFLKLSSDIGSDLANTLSDESVWATVQEKSVKLRTHVGNERSGTREAAMPIDSVRSDSLQDHRSIHNALGVSRSGHLHL